MMEEARSETRAETAQRLEDELEAFISEMAERSTGYEDGWPEDRWEEEMDKHPFFMKQAPDPSSKELPPLLEGLARLKFDPEENTQAELAANYKADGDFYFKNNNFRMAAVSYTEGLKVAVDDSKINSILYNNRSLAHFKLGNYRSSLEDCRKALSLDRDYTKCKVRAAHCSYKLFDFESCLKFCNEVLPTLSDAKLKKLKSESEKMLAENLKKDDNRREVLGAMRRKGIKMYDPTDDKFEIEIYRSSIPSIETPARLSEDKNEILWPIVILYPQNDVYDYFQEFPESGTMSCLIDEVLSSPAPWDERREYTRDNVNVFYIGKTVNHLHPVSLDKKLLEVMKEPTFFLRTLSPMFVIKLKNK